MRTSREHEARMNGLIPTAGELVQALLAARAGHERYICINTLTGRFEVLDHHPYRPHLEVRVNVNVWERNHRHVLSSAARLATKLAELLYELIDGKEAHHGATCCC